MAELSDKIKALNLKTNKVEDLDEADVAQAISAGTHSLQKGSILKVKDPSGIPGSIPAESAQQAFAEGFTIDSIQEQQDRALESEFGERGLEAAALGAASGLTFGLSDQALVKSGIFTPEELKALKERNSSANLAGEIVGVMAPLVLTGGTTGLIKTGAVGAKQLAKEGVKKVGAGVTGVSKAGTQAELLTAKALKKATSEAGTRKVARDIMQKTLPKMAGSAVEGAFYGTGQIIREDAIGNIDLNAENILAGAGLGALIGGSFGGILGSMQATAPVVRKVGGKFSEGVSTLKDKVGGSVSKSDAVANLLNLTPKQIEKFNQTRATSLDEVADFLSDKAQLSVFQTSKTMFNNLRGLKSKAGDRIGKVVADADQIAKDLNISPPLSRAGIAQSVVDDLTSNFLVKAETPGFAVQVRPIQRLIREWRSYGAKGGTASFKELHKLRMETDKLIKYEKDPLKLTLKEEALHNVRTNLSNNFKQAVDDISSVEGESGLLSELIDANRDFSLSSRILPFAEKKAAKDASKKFLSFTDVMIGMGGGIGASLPGAGVGEAVLVAGAVKKLAESDIRSKLVILSNVEKQANKNLNRISRSLDNYFKGTQHKLKRTIVPSTVLLGTSFDKSAKPKKGESKQEAFKRVSDQIQAAQVDPVKMSNTFNVRTLRMREAAPQLTQQLEIKTARAIEFLNLKMPKNPSPTTSIQPHLDEWEPSSIQMAEFENYLAATLDPISVIEDLSEGKATREGIEALKSVYPELYIEAQTQAINRLASSKEKISYDKRLQLGIMLDIPTDPSMIPENILGLQQQFDPGSRQTGAGVSAQGVINPTVTGITGIDASSRAQGGTEATLRRRSK